MAEKKLPLAAIHIQAAISNVAELTGASKGWKGSAVSTSLAWLGKACASEELERFARRSEIAQFVHGGIASVLTKSKPTAHAPWPGDHVLMSVEDLCHDANDEVAIAAAQSHLSYVGVRLGNTLLAYEIEIQDSALDESRNDIRPEGAKFLSEGLKANTGLTALKYTAYPTNSQLAHTVNRSHR